MAARHVGPHQLTHLRVDPGLDPLGEQPLADLLQVVDQSPGQRRGRLADEVFELDAPERVVQAGLNHAEQLAHAHVAAPQPLLGEDDGGEARDQRPVQVEKRADLGPGRTGQDLGDRAGQPQILCRRCVSRCSAALMSRTPIETPNPPVRQRTKRAPRAVPDHRPARGSRRNPPAGTGRTTPRFAPTPCRSAR